MSLFRWLRGAVRFSAPQQGASGAPCDPGGECSADSVDSRADPVSSRRGEQDAGDISSPLDVVDTLEEEKKKKKKQEDGGQEGHGSKMTGSSRSGRSPFEECDNPAPLTLPLPLQCQAKYSVVRYLNKGSSGFIVLVKDKAVDELKALKFVNRRDNRYILSEIVNQVNLRHPHVIKLEEILMTSEFIILVLEYAERGDLFSFLKEKKRFSERRSRWYFQQLMFAVDFCHRLGIVNRDIKLENLLLRGKRKEILKIADFGLSKDENTSALKSSVGTVLYMAPELITGFGKKASYDGKKAEVWACGVVLYTMLTGYYPFVRKGERALGQVKLMNKILQRTVNYDYPKPENVSEAASDLIRCMLHPDPMERYGVEDVIKHPWFQSELRFDVKEYNERVINHLRTDKRKDEGLRKAVASFLNAMHSWEDTPSLLESDAFRRGRAISDDQMELVEKMRLNPICLSSSSVVRFSDESIIHSDHSGTENLGA